MSVHINARMIGFWAGIVNGKKEKISRTLYDILYQLDLCDVYHSKWLNCVKDMLNKCGFINYWNDQFVPRNFNLSKKVKQYFYDSYVEYWKLQIFNAPTVNVLIIECINLNLVWKNTLLYYMI